VEERSSAQEESTREAQGGIAGCVVLAQDEALKLKHNSIGAEHILAGLLCEGGLAVFPFASTSANPRKLAAEVRVSPTSDSDARRQAGRANDCLAAPLMRGRCSAGGHGGAVLRNRRSLFGSVGGVTQGVHACTTLLHSPVSRRTAPREGSTAITCTTCGLAGRRADFPTSFFPAKSVTHWSRCTVCSAW
jgi:hypothetical protein